MVKLFDTLMEHDFDVGHERGTSNVVADGLSRNMEAIDIDSLTVDHLAREKSLAK